MKFCNITEAHVVRMPSVQKLSFIAMGMPSKFETVFFVLYLASDSLARSFAVCEDTVINALYAAVFFMRPNEPFTSSVGVNTASCRSLVAVLISDNSSLSIFSSVISIHSRVVYAVLESDFEVGIDYATRFSVL